MRRFAAIALLICFVLLGTGTLAHLHNLDHQREDAALAAAAIEAGVPVDESPTHDDNNCRVHAQLHAPSLPTQWVPLLIFLGIFVAFLSMLAPELAPQHAFVRIDCRGPPSR